MEKRDCIAWFHARRLFFGSPAPDDTDRFLPLALELARRCDHEDSRYLSSLFPEGLLITRQLARDTFLVQEDPRCWSWAAECQAEPRNELLRRSAEAGYAWGQALYGRNLDIDERLREKQMVVWLEKAAAQGEPEALLQLAWLLKRGVLHKFDTHQKRLKSLLLAAACLARPWRSTSWRCPIVGEIRWSSCFGCGDTRCNTLQLTCPF